MEFKFSELTSKKERSKKLDLIVEQEIIELPGEEIKILEPIKFDGELKMVDDVVSLYGNITTKLELECSRCLKNFSIDVNTDIDEKFSNNYKEDDSIALIEGDILDVADAIVSNVISTLPIKRLCSIDCKGLCQKCGIDLNKETCQCDNEEIDLRMAKLMDLFK